VRKKIRPVFWWLILAATAGFQHRGFWQYFFSYPVFLNIPWGKNLFFTGVWLLLSAVFLLAFWSTGEIILRLVRFPDYNFFRQIIAIALGLGTVNLFFWFFALSGLIYPLTVIILLVLLDVIGIIIIGKIRTKIFPEFFLCRSWFSNELSGWLLPPMLLATLYILIGSLSPPTSWDALAYHLPIAKLYARTHGLRPDVFLFSKQCTTGLEMLNAAAISLGFDILTQFFSFLATMLIIVTLIYYGEKNFSPGVGLLAATFLISSPLILTISPATNNDVPGALLAILSVAGLGEYALTKKDYWLKITAISAGLAASVKMTGLIIISSLLLWLGRQLADRRIKFRDFSLFLGLVVIFAGLPYLRNYLWSSNPVFPRFSQFSHKKIIPLSIIEKNAAEEIKTIGVKKTFLNFLVLPYYFIFNPDRFQHQAQYFIIPALIAAILRFLSKKILRPEEQFLGFFIVYYGTFWFFLGPQVWRFLLPVLPLLALLMAWWLKENSTSALKNFIVLISVFISLLPLGRFSVNNNLFTVLSLPSREAKNTPADIRYLQKSLDFYPVYDYVNTHLASGKTRVLLFREIRGYYLKVPYVWADPLNQTIIYYPEYRNPEELLSHLKVLGITHIIVNNNIYPPSPSYYDPQTIKLMNGVLNNYSSLLYSANNVFLFQVRY